jgi:hypothetical protein
MATAIPTIGHCKTQALADLVDNILKGQAGVLKTGLEALTHILRKSLGRHMPEEFTELLRCIVIISEPTSTGECDDLVDSLVDELKTFVLPEFGQSHAIILSYLCNGCRSARLLAFSFGRSPQATDRQV